MSAAACCCQQVLNHYEKHWNGKLMEAIIISMKITNMATYQAHWIKETDR